MNSKSNTMRGEMNGGERTGKGFANVLNLDRDRTRNRGASGERPERRGEQAKESRRQQQFYMTTAWVHNQTHHHLKETVSHIQGQSKNSAMPISVIKKF